MLEKIISTIHDDIGKEQFGGKAFWLKWLSDKGFTIPRSYFLKAEDAAFCTADDYGRLRDEFNGLFKPEERLAVRSSALQEDGERESKAGNYKTFLNVPASDFSSFCERHKQIVVDAAEKGDKAGVVLQNMIEADISGVIFTSNPENFSKKEMVISYCDGVGDDLVSGKIGRTKEEIIKKDAPEFQDKVCATYLSQLVALGTKIETTLNKPMDIEWCVEKGTGRIFILQCRPITSIFLEKNEIKKVGIQSIGNDERLKSLGKIKIRLMAEKHDILISDAYIVNCNCDQDTLPFNRIEIERSQFCRGYNIVVITPKTIDEKIVRHFVGRKSDAMRCITCNRYSFRAFPKYENLYEAVNAIYKQVKESSWICTMIIQEIFDPKFTGIIKAGEDAVFIEVARGHFVAKGVVPMSRYTIDKNGIHPHEQEQDKYYRILEGHQIEQSIDRQVIHIDNEDLKNIERQFSPILKECKCNLEFGLIEYDGNLEPYLIDFTEDNSKETIHAADIENGVISHGIIRGRIVKVAKTEIQQSLNVHCQNEIKPASLPGEPVIFLCDLPDINLMEKLDRKNIGFVFKGGSLLCHLSIILRERHIPALIYKDADTLEVDAIYELDTRKNEKVVKVKDENRI